MGYALIFPEQVGNDVRASVASVVQAGQAEASLDRPEQREVSVEP